MPLCMATEFLKCIAHLLTADPKSLLEGSLTLEMRLITDTG